MIRPKQIIGFLVVSAFVAFGVYNSTKEKGPLLSSTAEPFTTDGMKLSTGEVVDPWKVNPTSSQTAKLIEASQPGVIVERLFVNDWRQWDEVDANGSTVHLAELTSKFSRRDDSGRWEFKGRFKWADPGWVLQ